MDCDWKISAANRLIEANNSVVAKDRNKLDRTLCERRSEIAQAARQTFPQFESP